MCGGGVYCIWDVDWPVCMGMCPSGRHTYHTGTVHGGVLKFYMWIHHHKLADLFCSLSVMLYSLFHCFHTKYGNRGFKASTNK